MTPGLSRAALLILLLSGCALTPEAPPAADPCAGDAQELSRHFAGETPAPPRRAAAIGGLRSANSNLEGARQALTRLLACRADQARRIRAERAAGLIWSVQADMRLRAVRAALRQDLDVAIGLSQRAGETTAPLLATARRPTTARGPAPERLSEPELRELAATNVARREGFSAMVLVAGLLTQMEMEPEE